MKLSRETAMLRRLMIRTGRTSERMSRIHYTLVCLDRMAKFTVERGREWIAPDMANRLQTVSSDIASLVQFAEGLISRVQLLQDAATGIINIDQNDVMKVLTIASVVGIPPVLVVGVYGMNFKNMPEHDRPGAIPALALIGITALLPLIWFKWKDWMMRNAPGALFTERDGDIRIISAWKASRNDRRPTKARAERQV